MTQCAFLNRCREASNTVRGFLNDTLPQCLPPDYAFDPQRRAEVKAHVEESMRILKATLTKYSLEEVAVLYNGGKDCLVMLVLLMAAIHDTYGAADIDPNYKLDSIYVASESSFPQVSTYIESSTSHYHLNPVTIELLLRDGFGHYLALVNQRTKVIVVGIRHADPYGATLKPEQETDGDWPRFVRVHPVLHWLYVHVWDFILGCNLDYCQLYNKGYTSLGGVDTTLPNPRLQKDERYLPAYMLTDNADHFERAGRCSDS